MLLSTSRRYAQRSLRNRLLHAAAVCLCVFAPAVVVIGELGGSASASVSAKIDTDADGIPNQVDNDIDGDGILNSVDTDVDGDGFANGVDLDVDGDTLLNGDKKELDVDSDGIADNIDPDIDGDGLMNGADADVDGDGVQNAVDPDVDGDAIKNAKDPDIDGDGLVNGIDPDIDGDGILNGVDTDTDGDGKANDAKSEKDTDGDGIKNATDSDIDGDGILNEVDPDVDGDGIANATDPDIDGDGRLNGASSEKDIDGDGVLDAADPDVDGDGIANATDPDIDGDGVLNATDNDQDGDGVSNKRDSDSNGDGTDDHGVGTTSHGRAAPAVSTEAIQEASSPVFRAAATAAPIAVTASSDRVLILEGTVVGGASSLEAIDAAANGLQVDLVNGATWSAMTAAQFASYRAIILGDPYSGFPADVNSAAANASVWGPVINGNLIIVGGDPSQHALGALGAGKLVQQSINFAVAQPGKTGAFITLSEYYASSPVGTPVPLLDGIGSGGFSVSGTPAGCFDDAHIVADHPSLAGLTDADLANWGCSVHEAFESWPGSLVPLAIARSLDSSFTASDGSQGPPYILAGGDIRSSVLSLSPLSDTTPAGGNHTVTATLVDRSTSAPSVGSTLAFRITNGPNLGVSGTCNNPGCLTAADGTVTWTYNSNGQVGSDNIQVFEDLNLDGIPEPGERQTTAGMAWEVATNIAPVASFTATPTSGKAPLTVAFDGSASSDTDGTIVSYAWDFGDGTTSTGVTTTHTYTTGGTFSPQLTVTDDDGATNTTSQGIVVAPPNVAPVAAFTATPMVPAALPECGDDHDAADDQDECEDSSDYESEEYDKALAPSLLVAFDASASVDTDGTIESYTWDFGDGTTATGVTTTHTYTAAGAFTARLTITDNEGSTDTTTHEITVAAPGFGLRVTDDSGAVVWTVAGLFNNNKNVHVKYSSDGKVRKISGAATDVDPVGVRTNVSFSVIRTEHSSEYTGSIRIQRSDGAVKKFRFQVVGGVTTIAGGGATGQGSSKVCEDHDCAKWTLDWVVNKPLAAVHKERPSGSRGMTRAML